jgi:hypothetical protein
MPFDDVFIADRFELGCPYGLVGGFCAIFYPDPELFDLQQTSNIANSRFPPENRIPKRLLLHTD